MWGNRGTRSYGNDEAASAHQITGKERTAGRGETYLLLVEPKVFRIQLIGILYDS